MSNDFVTLPLMFNDAMRSEVAGVLHFIHVGTVSHLDGNRVYRPSAATVRFDYFLERGCRITSM
jgi:hypothetical protein